MTGVMRTVVAVVLVLVALLALIWLAQRRMVYFPTQSMPSAGDVGPGLEEVSYSTGDGLTLDAWFVPTRGEPRGTVLVLNGNAGNRSHRLPLGEALAEAGFSALLVDYRGYGGNPGSPSEEGLAADARAAVGFLRTRPEVDQRKIAYFGESLGAGVAVRLTADDPPVALVLRSPFTSLADIAAVHYRLIPASLLLRDRYPTIDLIPGIGVPVLVIAGSDDTLVPLEQSRRVFEVANEPKRLVIIDGAGHNDLALLAGEEMMSEIAAFLGALTP
jgi:fermentation-respiration switch protein FrsA (DUF1100 family)